MGIICLATIARPGIQELNGFHICYHERCTTPKLYLLVVSSKLVCPLVNALQGLLVQLVCHIRWARQRPGGLCAHRMLQELGQVLRGEVPEEVAALEQLVADLHGMVADLPRMFFCCNIMLVHAWLWAVSQVNLVHQ